MMSLSLTFASLQLTSGAIFQKIYIWEYLGYISFSWSFKHLYISSQQDYKIFINFLGPLKYLFRLIFIH